MHTGRGDRRWRDELMHMRRDCFGDLMRKNANVHGRPLLAIHVHVLV